MARGSIQKYQGKRGVSWRTRIELPAGPDGKRRWVSKSHPTKAAAEKHLAQELVRLYTGTLEPDTRLRFDAFLRDHWLPSYQAQRRPSSYAIRENDTRKYIIPALGHYSLSRLTPTMIQAFVQNLSANHHPGTVRRVASTLAAALNAAVERGLIGRSPARDMRVPPIPRRPPTIWTPQQFHRFLAAETDPDYRVLWLLLAVTGMRRGEALALRWSDIDAIREAVHVNRTLTRTGFGPPKSAAGMRVIPIPSDLLLQFEGVKMRQEARKRDAPVWRDLDLVFDRGDGKPLASSTVYRQWQRTTSAAGVPRIRPHDLRHGNASLQLEAGIPLKVVQDRLGHSSLATTANIYTHVTERLNRQASDALGTLLLPPPEGNPPIAADHPTAPGRAAGSSPGGPDQVV